MLTPLLFYKRFSTTGPFDLQDQVLFCEPSRYLLDRTLEYICFPGLPPVYSSKPAKDRVVQPIAMYHGVSVAVLSRRLSTPQGKYFDAEPMFRRALEITEVTLDEKHPQYSTCLRNLGVLLEEQVRVTEYQCICNVFLAAIDKLPLCCWI